MKKFIIGVLALFAIAIVAVVFLGSNLDSIVKTGIEKIGTQATKATTTVSKVDLSLASGKGALHGFNLGNPTGFSSEDSIKLGLVSLEIDPKSVIGNGPIVIRKIIIDEPELNYEVLKDGTSNLQTIQNNIKTFADTLPANKSVTPAEQPTTKDEATTQRKLIVDQLIVSNGRIKLNHELLPKSNVIDVKLPTLQMSNIGRGSQGVTSGALAEQVLQKIISKAMEAGQARLVDELSKQGVESLKSAVGQSDIGKAIGGLLGK